MPKFDVTVRPTDGNAFSIMGATITALRKAGATPEQVAKYSEAAREGDYDNLIRITMEWVNLKPSQ